MKIDDRIILYFDGQMSDEEKLIFEKEINLSSDLQKQIESYKTFLKKINESEKLNLDENYFTNVVPNFRKKIQTKTKRPFYPKIIYGLTTIAVIFISFLLIFNNDGSKDNPSLKSIISNMDSTELKSTLNDYSANILTNDLAKNLNDSTLNSIITDELNITRESAENVLLSENFEFNKIYSRITDEEAEMLYNELLNKKY